MIQKMFVTADGHQHRTAPGAARHEAKIALEMFLRENLTVRKFGDCDVVPLSEVFTLARDHSARLMEFAQQHVEASRARNFTRDEVQAYVIQELMKEAQGGNVAAFSLPNVWRATEVTWDYLVNSSLDSDDDEWLVSIAERAWDHFEGI
jgi:hypothetical protein